MLFHGSRFFVAPEYAPLFKAAGVERVEDVFRTWCPGPADPSRRSRVTELRLPHGGSTAHLFLKTYDYLGLWWLRTLLIPARVRREFDNLAGLGALGMKVARPVAWGQTRRLGFITRSFLVTEAIDNAIDLRDLYAGKQAPFPLPSPRERRDLIETFARRLRRCHDSGWFLHTAFFKNLLLTRGPGGCELHLIDVPFARLWRNRILSGQARVRDLGCLQQGARKLLSRTERMRFHRTWAGITRLSSADKAFLRHVDAFQRLHYP